MNSQRRVVITGGSGFIGVNLAQRLLEEGCQTHLLVRPGYKRWRLERISGRPRVHEVNFLNKDTLVYAIDKIQPQWIFHLAASGAYSWQDDLSKMIETNIIAAVNLLQASLEVGFEVFVNTGSSSEYGFKGFPPSEDELPEPNSDYALTKLSATLFCRHTARKHRARIPTLRLYSVYGPYEHPARFIPSLISEGLKGDFPELADSGAGHDFVYVDDVIEAYLLAARNKTDDAGAVYNVGTGAQTSLAEAVELSRRLMKIKARPRWGGMPPRRWDTDVWIADNRKIFRELGWRPKHSFEQGFQKTLSWMLRDSERVSFYQNNRQMK